MLPRKEQVDAVFGNEVPVSEKSDKLMSPGRNGSFFWTELSTKSSNSPTVSFSSGKLTHLGVTGEREQNLAYRSQNLGWLASQKLDTQTWVVAIGT